MKRILLALSLTILVFTSSFGQAEEPPVITVLEFATDEVSVNEMKTIVDRLSSSLFQTGMYTIIDATERDALLDELKFTLTGLADESSVLEVGKLLAAEAIVMGSLSRVGTKYVLSAKMLATETGKTLYTADGTYRNLDALLDDIPKIAGLLSGTVKGKLVYTKGTPGYKRRVIGISLASAGAAAAGVGGYLAVSGGILLKQAADTLSAYQALDGSATAAQFDERYAAYQAAFTAASDAGANTRFIAGLSGGAAGLAEAGVGIFLLLTPIVESPEVIASGPAWRVSIVPGAETLTLAFRVGY